jgi:hypothetical protein
VAAIYSNAESFLSALEYLVAGEGFSAEPTRRCLLCPNVTAGPRPAFSTAVGLPLVVESQI